MKPCLGEEESGCSSSLASCRHELITNNMPSPQCSMSHRMRHRAQTAPSVISGKITRHVPDCSTQNEAFERGLVTNLIAAERFDPY